MSNKAWGFGLATTALDGTVLDVWYPSPALGEPPADAQPDSALVALERDDDMRQVQLRVVKTVIDFDNDPQDVADVYLRLHLLSARLMTPNSFSLEGIYDILSTVVWTDYGPCQIEGFADTRMRICAETHRPVRVLSEDKVPRMMNYVVPEGIRISDGNRVRLGAYLAEGTVVTNAAFVDFNAGSIGAAILEGRINKGVVIDAGTYIGGGVSTMGALSADEATRVSVGKNCHIGNNAGLGIAIGDNCYVEEGLYITRNERVTVLPTGGIAPGRHGYIEDPGVVPAYRLAKIDSVRFERNSQTGAIEASPQEGASPEALNEVINSLRVSRLR